MGRRVGRVGEGSEKWTTLRSSVAVTEIMESAAELPRQNLNALANLHGPHLAERSISGLNRLLMKKMAYGFETKCTKPLSPVVLCLSFSA